MFLLLYLYESNLFFLRWLVVCPTWTLPGPGALSPLAFNPCWARIKIRWSLENGPCGDQHCQQIVFFGYFSSKTSFHHNSKNVDISRQLNNENQGWLDRRTLVAAAYTFAGFRSQCSSDWRWSRQPNTSWGHSRIAFMQALTEWALEQSSCLWKVTSTKRCLATSISGSGTDYPLSTIHLCLSFPPNIHKRT